MSDYARHLFIFGPSQKEASKAISHTDSPEEKEDTWEREHHHERMKKRKMRPVMRLVERRGDLLKSHYPGRFCRRRGKDSHIEWSSSLEPSASTSL